MLGIPWASHMQGEFYLGRPPSLKMAFEVVLNEYIYKIYINMECTLSVICRLLKFNFFLNLAE